MKTPREILLERHRSAEPQLDRLRRQVLAGLPALDGGAASGRNGAHRFESLLRSVWEGLVWPSRYAWAGLGIVWLALLAVNAAIKVTSPTVAQGPLVRAQAAQGFAEQQRELAELLRPDTQPLLKAQAIGPSNAGTSNLKGAKPRSEIRHKRPLGRTRVLAPREAYARLKEELSTC